MPSPFGSWERGSTYAPASTALALGTPVYTVDMSSAGVKRSAMVVRGRVVKNSSGVALLPKYLCAWKTTAIGTEVDGYQRTLAGPAAGFVDEHVVSTGVPNGDNFLLITNGPCLGTTSQAGSVENLITAGDELHGLTAAASTHSTTAGRVYAFFADSAVFTATQTTDGTANRVALNRIGRAISAKTTGQSAADVLLYALLPY